MQAFADARLTARPHAHNNEQAPASRLGFPQPRACSPLPHSGSSGRVDGHLRRPGAHQRQERPGEISQAVKVSHEEGDTAFAPARGARRLSYTDTHWGQTEGSDPVRLDEHQCKLIALQAVH